MPVTGPNVAHPRTITAGAAVIRHRFVKRGADADKAIPATAASINLGVALDNQDTVGGTFPIADHAGDRPLVEAGAAIVLDAVVTSDAQGRAVTATSGQPISGRARSVAGAAGDLVIVELIAADGQLVP